MEEVLNQELQDENLFSDSFETESTPTEVEETVTEEPTQNENQQDDQQVETEPFLNIRYDKQDISLTKEEAIELAQKGKNYDRINERYTNLNSSLERLAKMNGISVEEYLTKLDETQVAYEEGKELDALKEKYPNADEELLEQLAHQNVINRMEAKQKENLEKQKEQSDAQDLEIKRQAEMFRKEYPNVDYKVIQGNEQIKNDIMNGYTLLEAYNKWVVNEMKKDQPAIDAKSKAEKLNEENKKKSLGSTTNAEDSDDSNDAFFKGMNSI
ncbi:MAG: hypothetical protein KBT35_01270 [Firmicutes bacterium]|nr:hypothetical protein [Candidatus Colivicinus equi]